MQPPRLTFSGYYGFHNAGDEAVLAGLIAAFQAAVPPGSIELSALSIDPEETSRTHGIAAAHRYRSRTLLRALARTDLLLSGGGSLLQDVTSPHSIFYYLGVVRAAQIMGKKTMFIAQGIGPLRLKRSRRLTAHVAKRLNAITVRDPGSAALLREIGVTRPAIEVTADPALLLGSSETLSSTGDAFGVALRPWHGHDALAHHLAAACQPALHGQRALLFPMQPQSDKPLAEQFARDWSAYGRTTLCSTETGLKALVQNLASCGLIVGMRLHALILAAAAGVPSIALSYDPKVTSFMEQSGQGDAVYDLSDADMDIFSDLLARIWAERDTRAEALLSRLPDLRAAAQLNATIALDLVL